MKEVEQVKEEKPKKPVAKSMMEATEGDSGIFEGISGMKNMQRL